MPDFFEFLKKVPFFNSLPDSDILIIQDTCQEEYYEAGEIICIEGDVGENLFIIVEGSVEIWKNYNSNIKELLSIYGPGQLFGELALIDNSPRSATVLARQNCRLLSISRDDFNFITQSNTISKSIMRYLSNMIRKRTETFTQGLNIRNRKLEKAYEDSCKFKDQYQTALFERTNFISEIHHQIRNIMETLADTLNFQAGKSKNQQIFETCQKDLNRLRAITLFYDILCQSPGNSSVEAGPYIGKIAGYLYHSLGIQPDQIRIDIKAEKIMLLPEDAAYIGLIVNEMLSGFLGNISEDNEQISIQINMISAGGQTELSFASENGFHNMDDKIDIIKKLIKKETCRSFEMEENGNTRIIIRFSPKKQENGNPKSF